MGAITATTDLVALKKIFNDPGTVLFSKTSYDLSKGSKASPLTLTFDYRLPVTVDTFRFTQTDPTINHYKIIGMTGDWTSSATMGDTSIQFTVPTVSEEALKMAYGDDAVTTQQGGIKIGTDVYDATSLVLKKHKVTGTIAIVASNDTDIMLISGGAIYAKLLYDKPGTDPFAIQFTGGLELDGDKPSVQWLTNPTKGA